MTPTTIKVSSPDIPCSIDCFIVAGKIAKKKQWLAKHELFEAVTNLGTRIVTPVKVAGDVSERIFMMDVITGSLYDRSTGRCMTSNMLYMTKVIPRKNLASKLLKMKADEK